MMITYTLNTDWTCEYFEIEPDLFEFGAGGVGVPDLTAWRCEGRFDAGWAAYLQKIFSLTPTEDCVNYLLRVEAAPGEITLYVNGRRLGQFDGRQPFEFDITDYITLDDNRLGLRLDCASDGRFGRVTLRTIPCI